MQHMLKNHHKGIGKLDFPTLSHSQRNPVIMNLQTRHHYLSKTALMTVQLTIGSEKGLFLVAS